MQHYTSMAKPMPYKMEHKEYYNTLHSSITSFFPLGFELIIFSTHI